MPFPFEVGFGEIQSNLDEYVDAVFGCLESEFLVMPKGTGFVEFSTFETGYEALKRATGSFPGRHTGEGCPGRLRGPDLTGCPPLHAGFHAAGVGPPSQPGFEVVACIAGRGFGIRREDMKKLLLSTRGKVFTLQNMDQLVEHTRLAEFRSR